MILSDPAGDSTQEVGTSSVKRRLNLASVFKGTVLLKLGVLSES